MLLRIFLSAMVALLLSLSAHTLLAESDPAKNTAFSKLSAIDRKLYDAIYAGDVAAVASALKDGANANARLNAYFREVRPDRLIHSTPFLHDVARYADLDEDTQVDIIKLLLAHGAEVDTKDEGQRTALHYVAREGSARIALLLIDSGADINAKTKSKRSSGLSDHTPLHYATIGGNVAVLRALLDRGGDVNAAGASGGSAGGRTLLGTAVVMGHFDVVQLLLERDADINNGGARDVYGRGCTTPLHLAVSIPGGWADWKQERTEIIKLLLQYKPNTSIESSRGLTALEKAHATANATYGGRPVTRYKEAMANAIKLINVYTDTQEEKTRMRCKSVR